jgi:hypothetical protein
VELSLQANQRGVIEIEAAYELAERSFARFWASGTIPHIEIEHGRYLDLRVASQLQRNLFERGLFAIT